MTITRPSHHEHQQQILEHRVPERRYLPELHGIRGLALLGVVLFHLLGNGRVSGGIDIFLAISGFLFTGMLLREATARGGRIDPLKYYGRLVRRILIPAAIVIVATLCLGLFISPSTKHSQLWAEARASLLYFENFELINSQLAYGAAGPETSPFQHFWSLSVQGQFYIVWPPLAIIAVLIAKRLRTSAVRVMTIIVTVVLIASFLYAIWIGSHNQDEAYLMTTTRAWEIAFGGLLALAGGSIRLPKSWWPFAGWLGLALVLTCGFFLDGAQLFPGPWALWPLLGLTLVLISAGPQGGDNDPKHTATRFLSNKPLAWIGDHAYGLYLWHWPLLIYYLEFRGREALGWRGAMLIMAITVILAVLTYRYIERPLQQRHTQRRRDRAHRVNVRVVTAAFATLSVVGLAMSTFTSQSGQLDTAYGELDPDVYAGAAQHFTSESIPDAEPFPPIKSVPEYRPEYALNGCGQVLGNDPGTDQIVYCEDENAPEHPTATVVLAGGSHAGHLEAAFRALGQKYGWEVLVVVKSSCVFGLEQRSNQQMCGAWNANFITWLEQNDVDLVVTPATRLDIDEPASEYVMESADYWWDQITSTGAELLLVRGTLRSENNIADCLASGGTPQQCGPSKSRFAETNPILRLDLPDNAYPIDINPYVCPQLNNRALDNCDAIVGNIVVWRDKHHFTTPFSQSLASGFEAEMQDVAPHLLR